MFGLNCIRCSNSYLRYCIYDYIVPVTSTTRTSFHLNFPNAEEQRTSSSNLVFLTLSFQNSWSWCKTARQPIITSSGRLATSAGDVYFHNVISLRHLGVDFLFWRVVSWSGCHAQRASTLQGEQREIEREGGRGRVDGGGKCAEGVLLVIGANLNLPFARRSLY